MANITPFEAPQNLGLQPTEIGVESMAAAGRRGGAFYNQAGQSIATAGARIGQAARNAGDAYVDHLDHQQITQGAALGATMFDNLTEQKNQIVKGIDPNDPQYSQKIEVALKQWEEEKLEPKLSTFASGFSTEKSQAWAEHFVESTRTHMHRAIDADISTSAEIGVRNSIKTFTNTATNTALNDPSAMPALLDAAEHSIGGMVGSSNLKGIDAARVQSQVLESTKEQIVKASALGTIMRTGQAPSWLSDPKFSKYVNATEIVQLQRAERYYQNLNKSEARSDRIEQERLQRNDLNSKLNDIEREMLPQKPGDQPSVPSDAYDRLRQLYLHPGASFDRGAVESTVRKVEAVDARVSKPEPLSRVSHENTMKMLGRIRATDSSRLTDNGPIYEGYQRGDFTNADFHFLTNEFNNIRTPDGQALEKDRGTFLKNFARLIDGAMSSTGEHSLLGTQQAYQFEMDARHQEQVLRQQGKDPHLVYDPRSPEFFGRMDNIAKYRVTLQQANKYEANLKAMDEENAKHGNLTGGNTQITGVTVEDRPVVRTKAEYDKLAPGASFIDQNGKKWTKPK